MLKYKAHASILVLSLYHIFFMTICICFSSRRDPFGDCVTSISEENMEHTMLKIHIRTTKNKIVNTIATHPRPLDHSFFGPNEIRDELNTCTNNFCIYCSKEYVHITMTFNVFSTFNLVSFHLTSFQPFSFIFFQLWKPDTSMRCKMVKRR